MKKKLKKWSEIFKKREFRLGLIAFFMGWLSTGGGDFILHYVESLSYRELHFSKKMWSYALEHKYYPTLVNYIDANGISMLPTYNKEGEGVQFLCDREARRKTIKVNDIVTIEHNLLGTIIKRVVAVGGDELYLDINGLYRNGELVDEPYIFEKEFPTHEFHTDSLTIPEGHIYVLGDNRRNSIDSRIIGPVNVEEQLLCRVIQEVEFERDENGEAIKDSVKLK